MEPSYMMNQESLEIVPTVLELGFIGNINDSIQHILGVTIIFKLSTLEE